MQLFVLVFFIISIGSYAQGPTKSEWAIEKVVYKTPFDTGIIHFKNGHSFDTKIYEIKVIDSVQAKKKAPYLILTGRVCTECDANRTIYVQNPLDKNPSPAKYSSPGKELNYEEVLVSHFKTFYGNCFEASIPVITWIDLKDAHNTVVNLNDDKPKIKVISKETKKHLKVIESFISQGKCKEIPEEQRRAEL